MKRKGAFGFVARLFELLSFWIQHHVYFCSPKKAQFGHHYHTPNLNLDSLETSAFTHHCSYRFNLLDSGPYGVFAGHLDDSTANTLPTGPIFAQNDGAVITKLVLIICISLLLELCA